MLKEDIVNRLQIKGLKPTVNRMLILESLMKSPLPMSLNDIEQELVTMDKSSIYRVLELFLKNDVVDSFEDGRGVQMYELCQSQGRCDNKDTHLHFYCENCKKSYCLKELKPANIDVPAGFEVHSISFVIRGICDKCKKN